MTDDIQNDLWQVRFMIKHYKYRQMFFEAEQYEREEKLILKQIDEKQKGVTDGRTCDSK